MTKIQLTPEIRKAWRRSLKQSSVGSVTLRYFLTGNDVLDGAESLTQRIDSGEFDPDTDAYKRLVEAGHVMSLEDAVSLAQKLKGNPKQLNDLNLSVGRPTKHSLPPEQVSEVQELFNTAKEMGREGLKEFASSFEKVDEEPEGIEGFDPEVKAFIEEAKGTTPDKVELRPYAPEPKKNTEEVSPAVKTPVHQQKKKTRPNFSKDNKSPLQSHKESLQDRLRHHDKTQVRFEAKLSNLGITKEEAWEIIDCLMIRNEPYHRSYQLFEQSNRLSVEFRTRRTDAYKAVDEALEFRGPMTKIGVATEIWIQNLALSIVRFGGQRFDDHSIEERIEWASTLQEPTYRLLTGKLKEFDNFVEKILSEDFLRNF